VIRCPSCSIEVPEGSRFCPACGGPLGTITSAQTETSLSEGTTAAASSSPSLDGARFIPGVILAKRYRIVGLLGRGGMGEVYRADDLKLGRPVALKFLPMAVQRNETRLARFLNEARTALNVTHPNVCRVHDIGEVEGQHYLSMEYVDGEDLASLLRRIGRLPQDKAVEIARQICAGLAAAHGEGILHRDLKPANIMIDGRGRAKITDFGLASLAEGIEGEDAHAGTPVYMAPEQFAGKPASIQSDLYSLGLVLYELFTGKRAFDAETPTELARLHEHSTPTNPSNLVSTFDPAVERLLMRCLEKEPSLRPASALAVAAALPGGDPLAAALAAGETPSPEMVAGASVEGGLRPWVALLCVALIVAGVVGDYFLAWDSRLLNRIPPIKPPQVLAERSRALLESFGYADQPVDSAYGYFGNSDYVKHIRETDESLDRWDRLAAEHPPVALFWYRESPRLLVPDETEGRVYYSDPPLTVSGMANIELDGSGRLQTLRVVPPQVDETEGPSPEADWSMLFKAADLDMAAFTSVSPLWVPHHFSDARAAWEGVYPGDTEISIRIEAATYRGRPVFFEIVAPWTEPDMMEESGMEGAERILVWILLAIFLAVLLAAVLLARHNLRQGRSDRQGAVRIALFVWIAGCVNSLLSMSHVPDMAESTLLLTAIWDWLFPAAIVWLVYIALEPLARRWWPVTLISWNRLLAGRFRDPMIGRDILIGGLLGVALNVLGGLESVSHSWLGEPQTMYAFLPNDFLLGGRHIIAYLFQTPFQAVYVPILYLFFLLLLRMILRKGYLVVLVFYLLTMSLVFVDLTGNPILALIWVFVIDSIFLFIIIRLGLLAFCFAVLIGNFTTNLYLTTWYSGGDYATLMVATALVAYGFWISLAGRSLLRENLLE
jgi:hypothetical protein